MQIKIAEASVLIIVDGGVQFDGDISFSFEHYVLSLQENKLADSSNRAAEETIYLGNVFRCEFNSL